MKKTLLYTIAAFAGAAVSHAAVDDFTGQSGSLYHQNGGSTSGNISWTAQWEEGSSGQSAALINASMGSVNGFSSSSPYAEYTLGGNAGLDQRRAFTLQSGSVFYVYALVALGDNGSQDLSQSFAGIGLFAGNTEKFLIGERFAQTKWGVQTSNLNAASNDSTVSIGNFNAALLLAKIDQVSNTLSFFVNPDFSLTEAQNTAAFTLSYGTNDDSVDNIRLRSGVPSSQSDGNVIQIDNVNVTQATPFAVPEPSAMSLLAGSSALGCFYLARRRRA